MLLFDRAGPILARRSLRWQEKSQEIAAFQLLLAEPLCYGILRRVEIEEEATLARTYTGSPNNEDLTDSLRKDR
jgi:hypothetical protein